MRNQRRLHLTLNLLLILPLYVLGGSACKRNPAPSADLGNSASAQGDLEKALADLDVKMGQTKEVQLVLKLIKERNALLEDKSAIEEKLLEANKGLEKAKITSAKKKELEKTVSEQEKKLALVDKSLAKNHDELNEAYEALRKSKTLPANLKKIVDDLLERSETPKSEEDAPSPDSDESTKDGGTPPISNPSKGSRIVLETNAEQCLSFEDKGPTLAACGSKSSIILSGMSGIELRLADEDICLSARSSPNAPLLEKCNGAMVQKWNIMFRTSGSGFRIESGAISGTGGQALCLRANAGGFILDPCTGPVTYFLKKANTP